MDRPAVSGIPAAVRRVVLDRADGACERCGARDVPLELHHRKFRSRGGKHTAGNLIALCGWGNHTGCHGVAHAENAQATAEGVSVPSWGDPLAVPVWHAPTASWRLYDDAGGWSLTA
jgi:hypothetical protein